MSFAPGMVVLGPGEGRRLEPMGNVLLNKAVGADTGGSWALLEQHVTGVTPPLHRHEREDEAFYVLQGRARVWVGDDEFDAEPGSFVLAPRNVPHTYARHPGGDLKLLVLIAPAGFEQMFAEVVLLPEADQLSPSVLAEVAGRFGVHILGPPRQV